MAEANKPFVLTPVVVTTSTVMLSDKDDGFVLYYNLIKNANKMSAVFFAIR